MSLFSVFRLAAAAFFAGGLALLHGCAGLNAISDPERPGMFGEEVDSIVVQPFELGQDLKTPLNDAQRKLFRELLVEQIETQPDLRIFEQAPTELPNTLIMEGRLTEFEVEELPSREFFYRAIHIGLELALRSGDQGDVFRRMKRRLSYQKIYLPEVTVPVVEFDLRDAVTEIITQLTDSMFPVGIEGDIPLANGSDPVTGTAFGHPLLLRGNNMAADGRYSKARKLWRLVLFDPSQPVEEELFRISPRSLFLLKADDVSAAMLKRLEPVATDEPMDLVDFRGAVREVVGGFNRLEPKLLKLGNHHKDTLHLNLAAAHRNLAVLYWIESRLDLAVYHLARAYANYPQSGYVSKWAKIQEERNLIPEGLDGEEAIALYMRLPSPRGARLEPGVVENTLFPPVVFETRGEAPPAGAPSGASGGGAPLRPVELPPPPPEVGAQPSGLPPVQSPEQAGTPSTSGG